jgi:hypothetical protein
LSVVIVTVSGALSADPSLTMSCATSIAALPSGLETSDQR